MSFAAEYLAQLEAFATRSPVPRVRALHLPPSSAENRDANKGGFCALELEDGSLDLSYVLLDDTLDRMLAACRRARWFAMVGPSAGCLPDALFARGVTLLGGSWIVSPAGFVDALRRGESTSPFARKVALTPEVWPGTEALLARVRTATASPPRNK